jgi:hypothetical protein
LSATKAVLESGADSTGLAVLEEVLNQRSDLTVAFSIEMSKLLEPYGKRLPINYSLDWAIPLLTQPWNKKSRLNRLISLLDALDDPAVTTNIDKPIDYNSVLMHLSGFMDASSYWETPVSDIWRWDFGKNAEAIKEVLHAIAIISGVQKDQLILDVRILKLSLAKQVDDLSFYHSLVHVDTQSNWGLVKKFPISLENLEIALLQQSEWIIILATSLLEYKATKDQLLPIIRRLLAKGKATTLIATAHLISYIDVTDALLLIRNRLKGAMSDGCEALFEKLGELGCAMEDKDTYQCIENGLLCINPKVAIAAAKLAVKAAISGATDITALIRPAYLHWQVHEEPYPVSGGVIPDSPRSLLAEAMLQSEAVDDNELISMATDSRLDVREVCNDLLRKRLDHSESFRDLFLREIESGKLASDLLSNALKNKTKFSPHQCAWIRNMLRNDDATIRYAAISILVEPYSTIEEIKQHLHKLSQDSEADIQEIAHELSTQNLIHPN